MEPVIRLFSGRQVNPLDIKESEICIRDIAHGLALCNRFVGQTRKPISVAQHSVYAARMCFNRERKNLTAGRQALLHDAAEAYLGDMTKWLKGSDEMSAFRSLEHNLQERIFAKFKLPTKTMKEVEEVDRILVRFEGSHADGFGSTFKIDHPNYPPLTKEEIARVGKWMPWSWSHAEDIFMIEYRFLFETYND